MKLKSVVGILLGFHALLLITGCSHPNPAPTPATPISASQPVSNSQPEVILAANATGERSRTEAYGSRVAVSTQGQFATLAAKDILAAGGNLIDAAIATSFVLAVERPQSTGISGGGFMLYHDAKSKQTYAIDFRERAPLQATEKMFLGPEGEMIPKMSLDTPHAVATPGLVAGLFEIHKRFGKLPFKTLVEPAIRLAESGFEVYPQLANAIRDRAGVLALDDGARKIFLHENGEPLKLGDQLVQKDLASSLKRIAKNGRNGFYSGKTAKALSKFFLKRHATLSADDLQSYKVKWRQPVRGTFQGFEVVTMPPPSSGGIHVLQFLNTLEGEHLKDVGPLSARALHLQASSLQMAFADRAKFLGDPDFTHVPTEGLIAKSYANSRRAEILDDRARASNDVMPGKPSGYESDETTHFSMLDKDGNAIASTQTINGWMGAGIVVPGTGFLLNNEMDDFSSRPGSSNLFGAIGGKANAIAPLKTPLSSMSPTLLFMDGKPRLAIGAPGGTRIISCVAQTIFNYTEFAQPLYESIAMIRYHHQWQPDILQIDQPGPSAKTLSDLQAMGYKVDIKANNCSVMAAAFEPTAKSDRHFHAVADPRDIGTSFAK